MATTSDKSQRELLVRCMPMLFAFVRRRVTDVEMAREVVQEVSLRALAGTAPEHPRFFLLWSYGIARHVIFAEWRRRRRARNQHPLEDPIIDAVRDPKPTPDGILAARLSLTHAVGDAQDALDLLWRRYVDRTSGKELADELGLTAAALRMRLVRIRASARARYDDSDDRAAVSISPITCSRSTSMERVSNPHDGGARQGRT